MGLFSFVERFMRVPRGAHHSVQRDQPMPALPACGLKGTLERISEWHGKPPAWPYTSHRYADGAYLPLYKHTSILNEVFVQRGFEAEPYEAAYHLVQKIGYGKHGRTASLILLSPAESRHVWDLNRLGSVLNRPAPSPLVEREVGVVPVKWDDVNVVAEFDWQVCLTKDPRLAWVDSDGLLLDNTTLNDVCQYFWHAAAKDFARAFQLT